jgi:hypothetical protein
VSNAVFGYQVKDDRLHLVFYLDFGEVKLILRSSLIFCSLPRGSIVWGPAASLLGWLCHGNNKEQA